MIKEEIIALAKKQIAEKWQYDPAIFDMDKNVCFEAEDTFFEIITFGKNAVIKGDAAMVDWCAAKFLSIPARDIMDGDRLYQIETRLRSFGKKLSGEHIGYLHLFPERMVPKPDAFTYRIFKGKEIEELRAQKNALDFTNAFSSDKHRDVLAIAAYQDETIAAIAGSDDYLDSLWQIGIDTAPAFRNRGLAAYLVQALTHEIERQNKVAYYNTWSANLASTKVALSTGFYPIWMRFPSESIYSKLT